MMGRERKEREQARLEELQRKRVKEREEGILDTPTPGERRDRDTHTTHTHTPTHTHRRSPGREGLQRRSRIWVLSLFREQGVPNGGNRRRGRVEPI